MELHYGGGGSDGDDDGGGDDCDSWRAMSFGTSSLHVPACREHCHYSAIS